MPAYQRIFILFPIADLAFLFIAILVATQVFIKFTRIMDFNGMNMKLSEIHKKKIKKTKTHKKVGRHNIATIKSCIALNVHGCVEL